MDSDSSSISDDSLEDFLREQNEREMEECAGFMKIGKFKSERTVSQPEETKEDIMEEEAPLPVTITFNTKKMPRKRGEGCLDIIS